MPNPKNIGKSMLCMKSLGSCEPTGGVVFMRAGARVAVCCGDRQQLCQSYGEAMAAAYAMAFGD